LRRADEWHPTMNTWRAGTILFRIDAGRRQGVLPGMDFYPESFCWYVPAEVVETADDSSVVSLRLAAWLGDDPASVQVGMHLSTKYPLPGAASAAASKERVILP